MTRELPPIRALIVDDEERARKRLARMLAAWPSLELCAEAAGGREAVSVIDRLAPDLIFLDVQMPDLDGFAVLRALARPPRYVVFTTAYDRFALEAFAVRRARLPAQALRRARARANDRARRRARGGDALSGGLPATARRARAAAAPREPAGHPSAEHPAPAGRRNQLLRSGQRARDGHGPAGGRATPPSSPSPSSSSGSTRRASSAPTAGRSSTSASWSGWSRQTAVATSRCSRTGSASRSRGAPRGSCARAARDLTGPPTSRSRGPPASRCPRTG